MSAPTSSQLQTLDYAWEAQPFSNIPANSSIDFTATEYVFLGDGGGGSAVIVSAEVKSTAFLIL